MRVKCIMDEAQSCYDDLTPGFIYEVIEWTYGCYRIENNFHEQQWYFESSFEIVEEDKMENRIVRKLEDLNGLENGMGLKIEWDRNLNTIDVNFGKIKMMYWSKEDLKNFGLEGCLNQFKTMGFKFDFKPIRTINEVISEMKEVGKVTQCDLGDVTWEVYLANSSKEYCIHRSNCPSIGTLWFNQETAQKYADELNEIAGCK